MAEWKKEAREKFVCWRHRRRRSRLLLGVILEEDRSKDRPGRYDSRQPTADRMISRCRLARRQGGKEARRRGAEEARRRRNLAAAAATRAHMTSRSRNSRYIMPGTRLGGTTARIHQEHVSLWRKKRRRNVRKEKLHLLANPLPIAIPPLHNDRPVSKVRVVAKGVITSCNNPRTHRSRSRSLSR